MYLKTFFSLTLFFAITSTAGSTQIANSQFIKIDMDIRYLALKTEGDYLIVVNPNYLYKKDGVNYVYFLDFHQENIARICQQMNASVVFSTFKVIHEIAVRFNKDTQIMQVQSEKALDIVICKK